MALPARCYVPNLPILAVSVQMYDDVRLEVRPHPDVIQWLDAECIAQRVAGASACVRVLCVVVTHERCIYTECKID